MGMSASQARYLNLLARQSNLEYQGQQINQERSILSQQCTALYNSLLAMEIPTPPSTNDYTKIQYSGTDGATTFKLGNVKPNGENYLVELQQTATGASISTNYGSSAVSYSGADIRVKEVTASTTTKTGNYTQVSDDTDFKEGDLYFSETPVLGSELIAQGANVNNYVLGTDGVYTKPTEFDPTKYYYQLVSKEDYDNAQDKNQYSHVRENVETEGIKINAEALNNYYVVTDNGTTQLSANSPLVEPNGDGSYTLKLTSGKLYKEDPSGGETINNPNAGDLLIAGKKAYTFKEAANATEFTSLDWDKYREAIKNTYGSQDSSLNEEDFYVFFETTSTGVLKVQFALKTDVDSPDGFTETMSYNPNGQYTKSTEVDQCRLEFDSQGRITKISIPTVDEVTQKVISYRDITLKAETVTDNAAYQDAYAQFEYAQYEYDKKQQEINAKTAIIQQEDRNLELKLQRLDNERTQITTELEAVEKVINDNIESSYKTFSG